MRNAEVIKACTVNNAPKKPGDIVVVNGNTFRNMSAKGLLKAADPKKPTGVVEVPHTGSTQPDGRKKEAPRSSQIEVPVPHTERPSQMPRQMPKRG